MAPSVPAVSFFAPSERSLISDMAVLRRPTLEALAGSLLQGFSVGDQQSPGYS
jgi:hypothetical protein